MSYPNSSWITRNKPFSIGNKAYIQLPSADYNDDDKNIYTTNSMFYLTANKSPFILNVRKSYLYLCTYEN